MFSLKEDWTRALGFGLRRDDLLNARKTERMKPSFLKGSLPTATAKPANRAASVALSCPPGHWNGGYQVPPQIQQGSNNATNNSVVSQRGNETLNLDVANLIPPIERVNLQYRCTCCNGSLSGGYWSNEKLSSCGKYTLHRNYVTDHVLSWARLLNKKGQLLHWCKLG